MKFAHILFTAATVAAISVTPAQAGGLFGGSSGGWGGSSGGHSSTSGGYSSTSSTSGGGHSSTSSTSGGMPSSSSSSSSGGATSVPEPSDAILLLMGAAGVVIGRKLHARAKRKA